MMGAHYLTLQILNQGLIQNQSIINHASDNIAYA